jgi:hypothetical protein
MCIRTKSSEAGSVLFGMFFGFTFDSFKVSTLLQCAGTS